MRYYVKVGSEIEGPLTMAEINSRIAAGTMDLTWLATADLGETRDGIAKAPDRDWFSLADIPGVGNLSSKQSKRASGSDPSTRLILIWSFLLIVVILGMALLARFLYVMGSLH